MQFITHNSLSQLLKVEKRHIFIFTVIITQDTPIVYFIATLYFFVSNWVFPSIILRTFFVLKWSLISNRNFLSSKVSLLLSDIRYTKYFTI